MAVHPSNPRGVPRKPKRPVGANAPRETQTPVTSTQEPNNGA